MSLDQFLFIFQLALGFLCIVLARVWLGIFIICAALFTIYQIPYVGIALILIGYGVQVLADNRK